MAILVDFHQVVISNIMVLLHGRHKVEINEDLVRHMVLMSIKSYRKKFADKYGELIICTDSRSWRYTTFPLYKYSRHKPETSGYDREMVYEYIKQMRCELTEFFPYPVVAANGAEADDVIAVLTEFITDSNILIISGDKDFVQLQTNPRVTQYDPVRKKIVSEGDPNDYLAEAIIRGCKSDGIPNILSDANTFAEDGKRQKPITTKTLKSLRDEIPDANLSRYEMNRSLIDLNYTPADVEADILIEYENAIIKTNTHKRTKLLNYFIEKKLGNLMSEIQFF